MGLAIVKGAVERVVGDEAGRLVLWRGVLSERWP